MSETTTTATTEAPKHDGDALFLSTIVHRIRALMRERKDINDEIKAAMDAVSGRGFSKKALQEAMKLQDMDDSERDAHERSRKTITEALGCAVQIDLFADERRH